MKHKLRLIENLDQSFKLIRAATLLVIVLFLLIFAFGSYAQAISIEDLFIVPTVKPINTGAHIYQPQTGAGMQGINSADGKNAVGLQKTNSNIIMPNFLVPRYDAFSPGSDQGTIGADYEIIQPSSTVDAKLSVQNNMPGSINGNYGTTASTFIFIASIQTAGFSNGDFEYRFDFDGDNKADSYFSESNQMSHQYEKAGKYNVMVEILDGNGRVSRAYSSVEVVDNDKPFAVFTSSVISAGRGSIIEFDTNDSSDNQYEKGALQYRFDWDGDSVFDTSFQTKTQWYHLFNDVGTYNVKMEAMDPEGLTARAVLKISITTDVAPKASLIIQSVGAGEYLLDGSGSADDHDTIQELRFRWDFDYNGPNDIVFNTGFSNTPKQNVTFKIGGAKKVRLQVMDKNGQVSEAIAQISVPLGWGNLNFSKEF